MDSSSREGPGSSRRTLLIGAAGGTAALALGSLARVVPAEAANGDPLVLGSLDNTASVATRLTAATGGLEIVTRDSNSTHPGVTVTHEGEGDAVYGESHGSQSAGVAGWSFGEFGRGIEGYGMSDTAIGVYGTAPLNGVGVMAVNNGGGLALQVNGAAQFVGSAHFESPVRFEFPVSYRRSGSVTITHPSKVATVAVSGLTDASLILATVQNDVGVYVQAAVPNTSLGSFQIILNKAPGKPSAPSTARVAWFVVN